MRTFRELNFKRIIAFIFFGCGALQCIGQITIKSFPDFGNGFASSRLVFNDLKQRAYVDSKEAEVFILEGNRFDFNQKRYGKVQPRVNGACISCEDYTSIELPQVFTISNLDRGIIDDSLSGIPVHRFTSFKFCDERNDTSNVFISAGVDGSLIAFSKSNELKTFNSKEGREIDFIRVDISKLKDVLKSIKPISSEIDFNTSKAWKFHGAYLRKSAEKSFIFDWLVDIPQNGRSKRYFIRTELNEKMNFEVMQYVRIDGFFPSNIEDMFLGENDTRYFYFTSKRQNQKKNANFEVLETIPVAYQEEEGVQAPEAVREEIVVFISLVPDVKTFRISQDTLDFKDFQSFSNIIPNLFNLNRRLTSFYEVKALIVERKDSSDIEKRRAVFNPNRAGLEELKSERTVNDSLGVTVAKKWSFLNHLVIPKADFKKANRGEHFIDPENTFEVIHYSGKFKDTLRVAFNLPMFPVDYCTTTDGKLLILGRSRFYKNNFGAPIYGGIGDSKANSFYSGSSTYYYNENNPQVVSFLSLIEIPMNGELSLDRFSKTTTCDISAFREEARHFMAVFKNKNTALGSLEVGIYNISELEREPKSNEKDDMLYILIGGYIFQYDSVNKVFTISDGTMLKDISDLRAAIDLAIRSFLFMSYNVKHYKPICYSL